MHGLEFELWTAVVSGPREYGVLLISPAHIDQLKRLAARAGGWIVFDDDTEETLLPFDQWRPRFDAWNRDSASRPV